MGSLRLTLCTGVLAATATLTPAAHAADDGVSVSPSTPAPGSDVALRVTGCTGRTGLAASPAFIADVRLSGADGVLTGETRVRSSLRPAQSYEVKVTCDGADGPKSITTPLTLAGAPASGPDLGSPSAYASPVAPVKAGGGGTAGLAAADTRDTGPNPAHAVIGLILVGAAGVAVVVLGSRRSGRTG
ncbi:hypothetical protein I2W78_24790 [Streptomyces spinoverrucosus]|uniref:hypothetical protein n=1 Tax=Streptomyces spinoverrucosus TaxID=284043 RepID=UPI0018C3FDC1|nr:hypothetical protein [Streptomyces spinoverrucosus]MBG0854974.1 hypothetical protein [Streptomyces spinoverrucosus]